MRCGAAAQLLIGARSHRKGARPSYSRAPSRQTRRVAANEVRSRGAPEPHERCVFITAVPITGLTSFYFLKREFLRRT